MEHIHGVDVSWMTHGPSKDRTTKPGQRRNTVPSQSPREPPKPTPQPSSPPPTKVNGQAEADANSTPMTPPKQVPPTRPGALKNGTEKNGNGASSSPQRRGSWFSTISSKFSSSPTQSPPPQATNVQTKQGEISVPRANVAKNAVLQHAAKYDGEGPYTPAPPKSGQAGLLQVLRRFSASSGHMGPGVKGNHGLVERKVLNVDRHRERCPLKDLNQAKLRRVTFCVDVEIAPMPKYPEQDSAPTKTADKTQKRKLGEKGEGEALKNPKSVEEQKELGGAVQVSGEKVSTEPEKRDSEDAGDDRPDSKDGTDASTGKGRDNAKKKDKKKKNEEERKARKEKRRKLEVANGSKPMELHLDSDSSTASTPTVASISRSSLTPTTNPVRIYRRCCQLRETPILKKITEQLNNPGNYSAEQGVVEKLDLTGYWLQLPDLVTLGDYLAVVPIKEVLLESCGLTDEGLRVVLAGLLAAKKPQKKQRKPVTEPDELTQQGGVVERLSIKNNKIGPEGWKHLCLFIYMSRSLKTLDMSYLVFPQSARSSESHSSLDSPMTSGSHRHPLSICHLLSKSVGERLAGSTLELINLGWTDINADELGILMDGIIQCGIKRLGLAHNSLDAAGLAHVARYLSSGKCEGLDLGGNDIADQLEVLANSIEGSNTLWALSLAECGLKPASLCKLVPTLSKLDSFRFIDLSHNQGLFKSEHNALSLLRRYLPKMQGLKRIHLADVAMTSEHAIAIAEILPEIPHLAHISFLENPELTKLADAKTEAAQEEACALFASLLAATRVSPSIVAVDIDVPTEQAGDIVRAMAKQVVAYCLRNMERLPLGGTASSASSKDDVSEPRPDPQYPDVIQHLVGHDVLLPDGPEDNETAPDDDYVIGGTGVVKALDCCLKNIRADDSRRQSGEFIRDVESGTVTPRSKLPSGKAKDMSKHLLWSARKIRLRLQPALEKARASSGQDTQAYNRLLFLDSTLDGIIKRFEDEFPDTRLSVDSAVSVSPPSQAELALGTSFTSTEAEPDSQLPGSDVEDDIGIRSGVLSRSNSVISVSSKGLTNEEGRVLRAGHKFRSGWIKMSNLLSGVEEIGADPNHNRVLHEMLDDIADDDLQMKVKEKGVVRVFLEDRDQILQKFKEQDPEHWDRFIESQKMARANVKVDVNGDGGPKRDRASSETSTAASETAVAD